MNLIHFPLSSQCSLRENKAVRSLGETDRAAPWDGAPSRDLLHQSVGTSLTRVISTVKKLVLKLIFSLRNPEVITRRVKCCGEHDAGIFPPHNCPPWDNIIIITLRESWQLQLYWCWSYSSLWDWHQLYWHRVKSTLLMLELFLSLRLTSIILTWSDINIIDVGAVPLSETDINYIGMEWHQHYWCWSCSSLWDWHQLYWHGVTSTLLMLELFLCPRVTLSCRAADITFLLLHGHGHGHGYGHGHVHERGQINVIPLCT